MTQLARLPAGLAEDQSQGQGMTLFRYCLALRLVHSGRPSPTIEDRLKLTALSGPRLRRLWNRPVARRPDETGSACWAPHDLL
jgi:hypothetical protein